MRAPRWALLSLALPRRSRCPDCDAAVTAGHRKLAEAAGGLVSHMLPAEWEGGTTWVYFEGVHHYSFVWLNGVPLGEHINGFLSFWYRPSRKEWSTFSLIAHGCLLGIFTEGLDFYGSVEMKIIETKHNGPSPRFHQTLLLLLAVLAFVPLSHCARCCVADAREEEEEGVELTSIEDSPLVAKAD